jgi:hypothetical protein
MTLAMFPISVLDLTLAAEFLGKLDLTVVASCCSVQLDLCGGREGYVRTASAATALAAGLP